MTDFFGGIAVTQVQRRGFAGDSLVGCRRRVSVVLFGGDLFCGGILPLCIFSLNGFAVDFASGSTAKFHMQVFGGAFVCAFDGGLWRFDFGLFFSF